MQIAILVLDDVFDLGLSALLDTLGTAKELAAAGEGQAAAPAAVRVVGVRRQVSTHQGMRVPVKDATGALRPDVVLVPALAAKTPQALLTDLRRRDITEAGELLRGWAAAGTLVGAACTGTFVLAEAALLDGRRATTTWWLSALFRSRYPLVELDESRMVIEAAGAITAGAALAHIDLALWIVRRRSPELAALVARYLVVEPRLSQAVYAIPDHLAHEDEIVKRFERWAREHLTSFSLGAAARAVGTSERTLARRTSAVLGKAGVAQLRR